MARAVLAGSFVGDFSDCLKSRTAPISTPAQRHRMLHIRNRFSHNDSMHELTDLKTSVFLGP